MTGQAQVGQALGWIPWLIAGLAILAFPILIGPSGLVFAAGWALVLLVVRHWAASQARPGRLSADAVTGVVCLLGAYVGGWYLLPAIGAFALIDLAGIESPTPRLRSRRSWELVAAAATLCAGAAGLLFLLFGGVYTSVSSAVAIDGTVTNGPAQTIGFLTVNGTSGIIVVIAAIALHLAVAGGALLHARWGMSAGHLLTGAAAIGLVLFTVLGALSIGPWFVPSAILGIGTWLAGRTQLTPAIGS